MDIKIVTEYIKLDQLLKLTGEASNGAEAKVIINNGKVKVNGEIEVRRGRKIRKGDRIELDGRIIQVV